MNRYLCNRCRYLWRECAFEGCCNDGDHFVATKDLSLEDKIDYIKSIPYTGNFHDIAGSVIRYTAISLFEETEKEAAEAIEEWHKFLDGLMTRLTHAIIEGRIT